MDYRPREPTKAREAWSLQDAKARFSEVVRMAQQQPQRVSVHGRNAVVIISAKAFERMKGKGTGKDLVDAFANSPLANVQFDRNSTNGQVRDIKL